MEDNRSEVDTKKLKHRERNRQYRLKKKQEDPDYYKKLYPETKKRMDKWRATPQGQEYLKNYYETKVKPKLIEKAEEKKEIIELREQMRQNLLEQKELRQKIKDLKILRDNLRVSIDKTETFKLSQTKI